MPVKLGQRTEVKSEQNAIAIRQVTDNSSDRCWELFDNGGGGEDFLIFGELSMLKDIDHDQLIATTELLLTDPTQVVDGRSRSRGLTRHVELDDVFVHVVSSLGAVPFCQSSSLPLAESAAALLRWPTPAAVLASMQFACRGLEFHAHPRLPTRSRWWEGPTPEPFAWR